MDVSDLFWNASVEELQRGYICRNDSIICLICGERFEKGIIYQENNQFFEAEKFMQRHIIAKHQSTFDYLIGLDKKYTGLSDIQKEYLLSAYKQCSDRDIAKTMGCSESAVRNQRFKLREKIHQAKILLALSRLSGLAGNRTDRADEKLIPVHKSAAMIDLRYAVTQEECEKIQSTYFDDAGHLKGFPTKEKKKIVVLRKIAEKFSHDRKYSEIEVNRLLERIYDDYATLRRELIEYGFMDRTTNGSSYWIKD